MSNILISRTNDLMIIDVNEYLPIITKVWCDDTLQKMSYDLNDINFEKTASDGSRLHRTMYLELQKAITDYIISTNNPELNLCVRPTGGRSWQPTESFVRREKENTNDQNMDIVGDEINEEDEMLMDFEQLE